MDIAKIISNIMTSPTFTFILGTISGAIISSLVSYFFSYIKDRYASRDRMYLQISDNLSKKLYDCSQLAYNTHIHQFKTSLSIYKSNISTAKKLEEINAKFKLTNYEGNSKIYEAKQHLSNEKIKLLDTISEFQKSLIEIILYMEANYIVLNMFSNHKDEYFLISSRITEISDKLFHLLYFDEIIEWEESLDDNLLILINNKIDELEKALSEIDKDILAYISDFQVGLQNEFFSKYFRKNFFQKYNVNYREPLVGKVIKPEKSTKKNLTLYK
ncbi:MAG: hypothetical protein PHN72_00985 [Bacilli bacterium]|nr:hypothetical protein [Bacilli bacterium]